MTTFQELGEAIRPRYQGEPIDLMIKRLKKVVEQSGVLSEARRHSFAATKSERRRHKQIAARRRAQREQST
jgi:ribosomal protein S21